MLRHCMRETGVGESGDVVENSQEWEEMCFEEGLKRSEAGRGGQLMCWFGQASNIRSREHQNAIGALPHV